MFFTKEINNYEKSFKENHAHDVACADVGE